MHTLFHIVGYSLLALYLAKALRNTKIDQGIRRFAQSRFDKRPTITVTGPSDEEIRRILARLESPAPDDKDTQKQRED